VQLEGLGGGRGIALGAQGNPEQDGWLLNGLKTTVGQLDGKVVIASGTTASDHVSIAGFGFPTLFISWRLAGDENLSDNAAHTVKPENLRFSGQAAALLLMSLAQ
jgi:hypothetical protein